MAFNATPPTPALQASFTAASGATTTSRVTPFFGRRLRPWLDGYRALFESAAAAKIAAVSQVFDATRVTAFSVSGGAAAQTFDVPSGFVDLTTAADLDTANVVTLLSAIMIKYLAKDRSNAVVVPRSPVGGTLVAGEWKIDDANTVSIFTPLAGSVPTIYELIVPAAANIYNPVATSQLASNTADAAWTPLIADNPLIGTVADYLACRVGNVVASRVLQ